MPHIKVGGSLRALLNERFIVWVQMFDKMGTHLKLILPDGLKLTKALNYKLVMPKRSHSDKAYLFDMGKFYNPRLAAFELKYVKIVEKPEPIVVECLKDAALLEKGEHITELLKPDIEIKISIREKRVKSGLINVKIIPKNDVTFLVKNIDLKVFNSETNEELNVRKSPMVFEDFIKVLEELPPDINPDQFLGNISIPKHLKVKIRVDAQIYDLLENEYNFVSNILPIPKEIDLNKVFQPLGIPQIIPLQSMV